MIWLRSTAVILTAICLVPAGSHLVSMANKMRLSANDYFVAQRAYDGWNLFGIPIVALCIVLAWLVVALHHAGESLSLVLAAFGCVALSQVLFWTITFPANRSTANWTTLPDRWEVLRTQWEWSHASAAVLILAALVLLTADLARS